MPNTGYRIYPTLIKVSDDINEYPLDVNNHRTSVSGLPQDSMAMLITDPRYKVLDSTCAVFTFIKTGDYQRNNCTPPQTGTTVTYSETYYSDISEADAEAAANADQVGFDVRGQANANTVGTCVDPPPPDAIGIMVVDMDNDTALEVCCYIDTPATTPYHIPVYTGINFNPNDGTEAKYCWMLASDISPGSTIAYRFIVNFARLINNYPSILSFDAVISGRRVGSANFNSGYYSLKGPEDGLMRMDGTPGNYRPTTENIVPPTLLTYSGKAVSGGGDGTRGFGIGAEILRFRYDVPTKALTLL